MDESQTPISKNEFYLVQKNVSDRIKNNEEHILELKTDINEKLDLILIQTTKTNGSVKALQIWQGYIKGGLAIITLLLIPIIIFAITDYIHCKSNDCTATVINNQSNK